MFERRRADGRLTKRGWAGHRVVLAAAVLVLGTALGGCSATAGGDPGGSGGGSGSGGAEQSGAGMPEAGSSASADGGASGAADRGATGSFQNPDLGSGRPLTDGGTGAAGESAQQGSVVPVRVSIPAIGVDSGLESLTRDGAGSILPPVDFGSAGWFSQGVVPGAIGPAVIAGHVDSAVGPAVFYRLSDLRAGDQIDVALSDGSTAAFAVDREMEVAKADFPTFEVYGPTPTAQLRLITCGGVFDDSYGHYLDNVVVFATRL